MSANTSNYVEQGGSVTVIGGELRIAGGATVTAAGTQAANIAATTVTGTYSTGAAATINSIITALEGVGILATS